MEEEKKEEDVVERLAREFLRGMEEEGKKAEEPSSIYEEPKEEPPAPTYEAPLTEKEPSLSVFEETKEEEPYFPTYEVPSAEKEEPLSTFEVPKKEPYMPTYEEPLVEKPFEAPGEKPSPLDFEVVLPEKEPSLPQFEEPEEPPASTFEVPLAEEKPPLPQFEESLAETYPEKAKEEIRPSDEKIEEILAKLEEEEKGVSLPKEPVKVEEEEEEEFAEIPEVSEEEEILEKRPKKTKKDLRLIKIVLIGCLLGGIIGGGVYFGKNYLKPVINLVNLNVVNKLLKPSCDLRVSSNPSECDLFVDDIVKGKTPITIKKLSSGDHNIRIEKEGFKPYISVVSVTSRKPIDITPNLEPEIRLEEKEVIVGTATLIVRTEPKDALVYIDGARIAKMPYLFLSGTHSIRVQKDGFSKFAKIIEIKPEEVREISVCLTPILGSIFIDSIPRGGCVLVNNRDCGKTPLILKEISPWKPFRITIRKNGYFDWNGVTFVEPNQRTKVIASLKKTEGQRVRGSEDQRVRGSESRESESRESESQGVGSQREEKGVIPYKIKEEKWIVPSVPVKREEKTIESASILELKRAIESFKEKVKVEAPVVPSFPEEPYLKREFPPVIKEKPKQQPLGGGSGYCFITSIPSQADIFLDGRLIGKTPIREFVISPGRHTLKASLSGFKEAEKEIIVSAETTNFFNFSLSK
ncbi:MAG: PEGA domain-containing protein [bacterium]